MAEPREVIFQVSALKCHAPLLSSPEGVYLPFMLKKKKEIHFSIYYLDSSTRSEHLEQEKDQERAQ